MKNKGCFMKEKNLLISVCLSLIATSCYKKNNGGDSESENEFMTPQAPQNTTITEVDISGAWLSKSSKGCFFRIDLRKNGTYEMINDCMAVVNESGSEVVDLTNKLTSDVVVLARDAYRGTYNVSGEKLNTSLPTAFSCKERETLKSIKTSGDATYTLVNQGTMVLKYLDENGTGRSFEFTKLDIDDFDASEGGVYNKVFSPNDGLVILHGCLSAPDESDPSATRKFYPKQ